MSSSRDKLRLSDPMGSAPKGHVVLDRRSIEDQLAERAQLIENEKRIAQLERSNAELEAQLAQIEPAVVNPHATGQGKVSHIAHSEGWEAICTAPDFCKVGNAVVAFNSFATLDMQQTASPDVKARGTAVYRIGDMIKKVQGDAGKHIVSGTSLGSGHVKILDGHDNVKVNGIPVARHDSRCVINCDASGVGGAQGKLVTERKSVGGGGSTPKDPVPPGERTSEKLAALKKARASVADGMLDLDALDAYVNFDQSNQALSDLIAQISGTRGTAVGYAAEVTRGVLGFGKDLVMGAGELAYEGIKAVPKVVQLTQTQSGKVLAQLDAKILGENIKLGNITPVTVGRGALDVGKAIVKPVTDPWAHGDYVEAVTRGIAEVGSIAFGWLKGSTSAKAAKAANTAKVTPTTKGEVVGTAALSKEAGLGNKVAPPESSLWHVNGGVHVSRAKRARPAPNGFEGPDGYKTHGIQENPLHSPEGRRLVDQYKSQGMTHDDALKKAREIMASGATPPVAVPLIPGDKLYKVAPEGSVPGKSSAFFATKEEIADLKGMSYDEIADRLGIPLESQQTTRFDVLEVTVKQPTIVFESVIAKTTQAGYGQPGGGIQTIITDRSLFADPVLTGIKLP